MQHNKKCTGVNLLLKAFSEGWILITNDKDFGEMVYRERRRHQVLLDNHAERLPGNFVVVTEDHVRFANTPSS
ncbi:hypothetical protein [Armatimonas sp.]|uniref:hypothetical protein n=1 Tax=Armatimonas sp. TaxID=1872638 RepID=UPI003750CEE5